VKLGIILVAALAAAGCGGAGGSSDVGAEDSAQTGRKPTGTNAERLIGAFGKLGAVDNAMGGRAGVDVKSLTCLTASNGALDEDDPLFLVPITTCTFENTNEQPPHHEAKDDAAKAGVLYDAIAAVDESLVEGAAGTMYASAKSIVCEGHGPSAGSDPDAPPPTTVSCKVTTDDGRVIDVDAAKSKRLAQAFGLFDVIDHAMGGAFGVEAHDVQCALHPNTALDETDSLFGVATHGCSMSIPGRTPEKLSADDAEPKAAALLDALEKGGATADSAMGKTGVTLNSVTCRKGPGAATSCTLR
jgi:hypothetical protein